jgi:hypothetical protein
MTKRIGYVCSYCGSSAVLLDAWAEWDAARQDWVLAETSTTEFCRECDEETRLTEVELIEGDSA